MIDADFVEVMRDIFDATGFRAEDLEFEITESTTVHDYPMVNAMLMSLGALGVPFSIDDFGTGYSSLSQLKRLPIDRLKIDITFVEGLPKDSTACAMVEAIIAMARALDLRTTAEGVETPAQVETLAALGCEEAQGYYRARPLAPNALLGGPSRLQMVPVLNGSEFRGRSDGLGILPPTGAGEPSTLHRPPNNKT